MTPMLNKFPIFQIQDASHQQLLQHSSLDQNTALSTENIAMVSGSQQQVLNSLQASLSQAGHIILAGTDTGQLGSKLT